MPSTLVEHSLQTRRRHCTHTPIASRCRWFSQTATAMPMARLYHVQSALPLAAQCGRQLCVAPVLIVKTGTTVPDVARRRRDFESWISAAMGLGDADVQVSRVYQDEPLPDARAVSAVVVTGSSAMVTDREPWS